MLLPVLLLVVFGSAFTGDVAPGIKFSQYFLAGMLASGAGLVLGRVSSSPVEAAGALFQIGVGWSAAYLGSTAVVSDLATPSERAGALGLTDLVAALSAASGVLGGAAILELSGFVELTFVALALLALPAALLLPLREATPGTWSSPAREAVQKG